MAYTLIHLSDSDAERNRSYWKLWVLGILVLVALGFLHWGGNLLVATDPLPGHVNAAVVLHGSVASEKARVAAAMAMLQRGAADRVALSVPTESYWGEAIPPIARQYVEKNYGADLADRVDFCETAADLNSTNQEAQEVGACVQKHQWKTIALVTSNYDSRRAGMIWKKTLRDPSVHVWVDGLADPNYQPRGWWHQRLYAKIWCMEVTKLVWALV